MRFAEVYRNLILTVIAALLALIAFQRGGPATVQAQGSSWVQIQNGATGEPVVKKKPLAGIPGQVKAMWCTSPSDCYAVVQ
jgi:hypothetical protein